MKNQTMQNQSWHDTTVVRMTSVVPSYGFGTGEMRLDAVASVSNATTFKRHAAAIKATPATGFQPWSPPVT